jgi:hypothetical protein
VGYRALVLLREDGDAVIAIGQASHAWLAGQLARAWGNERFAAPEPREEVCLAAEQHDVGMAEWDLRPSLNPQTGRPHSFLELPVSTHVGLWTAAPAKLLSQCQYAALLVSMHGAALNERRDLAKLDPGDRDLVSGYLDGQRALQAALAAQLGADPGELARNLRLLQTWDSLSLAACSLWRSATLSGVPAGDDSLDIELATAAADRFTVDPWPFNAERLEVRCEGRRLEGRFDTEAQLHEALERAPVVTLVFALEPRG